MTTLLDGIIVAGVFAGSQVLDNLTGTPRVNQPIFACPLLGLLLGDFQTGLYLGAVLQVMFMAAVGLGNAMPPDGLLGGVLATAFAIRMGIGTDAAIAMAMPIAVIGTILLNTKNSVMSILQRIIDKFVEENNPRGVDIAHWGVQFGWLVPFHFIYCFIIYMLGGELVLAFIESLPQFVFDGMTAFAGVVPAIGIAMLMKMVFRMSLVPYYFLGFFMSAYLGVPILGVAIVSVIIVTTTIKFGDVRSAVSAGQTGEEEDEDDF